MNRKKTNLSGAAFSKLENLSNILREMENVLVAFSGGVDSTFLLKVAKDVLGQNVSAVIASSETYPQGEIEEAKECARKMGIRYRVIQTCELDNPRFVRNPPERCYFCKKELFSLLKEIARAEDIPYVLDGANHDDKDDFRPGTAAAEELGIRSPLREAELGKDEIRALSKDMGLLTWDKPSLACLASRFPYYTEIRKESLEQVGRAEDFLRSQGLGQVRVRHHGRTARIEVEPEKLPRLVEKETRKRVVEVFRKLGYNYVTLDLAGYRTGSMNEILPEEVKSKQ